MSALVLVAVTDSGVRAMLRDLLTGAGYDVACAATAADTFIVATERAEEMGCIILDVAYPDSRGDEVVGALRADAQTAHLPVLVAAPPTGPTPEWTMTLLALDARGFLDPAAPPEEVVFRVNQLVHADLVKRRTSRRAVAWSFCDVETIAGRFAGFLFNISEGGAFIRTTVPVPTGATVDL